MLSILIPTYNYDITKLITELHQQCRDIPHLKYEIIVYEDGTTNRAILDLHKNLTGIKYYYYTKNIGRTAARNFLAHKAVFNTLLFLDADTLPRTKTLIKKYITISQKANQPSAIFGGCSYKADSYSKDNSLRYYYGKKREENSAVKRNKNPYTYVFSGNFIIEKKLFLSLKIPLTNIYGMDNYFSYLLKKNNVEIIHIDNEIIHLGIESNIDFFNKSLTSAKYRKENMLECYEIITSNSLLKTYNQLNFFPLNILLKGSFKLLDNTLKKLFFKPVPSLRAFDLYRLLYLFNLN